jgi:hypothetical protein
MLLGAGFALQAARSARQGTSLESFDRFFRRRMILRDLIRRFTWARPTHRFSLRTALGQWIDTPFG